MRVKGREDDMLVKVEAYHDGESWCARGIGEDFFTQGETLDELVDNVKEAAGLHFEDRLDGGRTPMILSIHYQFVRHWTPYR